MAPMQGLSLRHWTRPGLFCLALTCWLNVAQGQDSPDDLARRHFESGVAYLQESDHESALKAFQRAYDLSKRAEILLNIGTVQERLNALPEAIAALEQYLSLEPQGEHAETARLRIDNLKRRLEQQRLDQQRAEANRNSAEKPPPAAPAPPPAVAPPPNRVPAFIAFGIGAAAAGGAVLTGVMANAEHSDLESSCAPRCSDDQTSSGRTLALTSTVLTGLAVVGAGVGAVLWFSADSRETASAKPRFGVGLGLGSAQATLKF